NLSNAAKAASRAAEIASRVEAPKAALTASETALMVALVEAASRLTASEALPRAAAAVLKAGARGCFGSGSDGGYIWGSRDDLGGGSVRGCFWGGSNGGYFRGGSVR